MYEVSVYFFSFPHCLFFSYIFPPVFFSCSFFFSFIFNLTAMSPPILSSFSSHISLLLLLFKLLCIFCRMEGTVLNLEQYWWIVIRGALERALGPEVGVKYCHDLSGRCAKRGGERDVDSD
ncbi:hypothetical protein V8F20_006991 [Naviculisporaceae sp. PSN 640]